MGTKTKTDALVEPELQIVDDIDELLETRWIVARYGSKAINIGYQPEAMSMAVFDEFVNIGESLERPGDDEEVDAFKQSKAIVKLFLMLGLKWTLKRNGEPIPTNAESLHASPIPLLSAIFEAIMGDQRPNQQTSGA